MIHSEVAHLDLLGVDSLGNTGQRPGRLPGAVMGRVGHGDVAGHDLGAERHQHRSHQTNAYSVRPNASDT